MRSSGPYETEDERRRRELAESKKLWVAKKDFDTVFSSRISPQLMVNYITMDPSDPPSLHKFRTENKKRWLAGKFIV